ncbi:DUF4910 domain-containing protein [candidate division KSB1 bacterium]|nr:DUF4910 domain-containing protein [candidate division KSB1 bacterium]
MKRISILFAIVFFVSSQLQAQQFQQLLDNKTRDLLHEALSGELAKEHVIQITRHHRIQGSRGYRDAANYVLEQLRSFGFSESDAYIESFKSDGIVTYQTWQSPSGWDIESAELRMIEPYEERIVGYPEIAMSVITYSNAGDETAELVWVGAGTSDSDYAGKDVKDKFVLATGYGGNVHRLAVLKYGAKAVVCYLDDDRAAEYPDMLAYTGMWPRTEELDRVTFGFNLTNRQGEKLKNLLLSGQKVVVHGRVSGIGLESYFMDVVVAHIRGSEFPDEELVYSAHLDHPKESANDNASGSAAILDMARALNELIENGRLERPKRSLRFIWVPEYYGTMAYVDAHPEMVGPEYGGSFLANINMDMVGENQEIIHTQMYSTRTPSSIPSVLNDVVANMVEMVSNMDIRTPRGSLSKFNYAIVPYTGGSDHNMFIDRKIPGVMFGHTPDYTHHTSEDTPDKVDPVELERTEIIAAGTMLYLANLDEPQAIDLANLTAANSFYYLGEAARRANRLITTSSLSNILEAWLEALLILEHEAVWQQQSISSILYFNNEEMTRETIASLTANIDQLLNTFLRNLRISVESNGVSVSDYPKFSIDTRVPVRLTRGPLASGIPENRLDPADAAWYNSSDFTLTGNRRFELHNFINGTLNVTSIRSALSAEYGPVPIEVVTRYIEDLIKAGVVRWK